jgi:hypothetical protein
MDIVKSDLTQHKPNTIYMCVCVEHL